MSDTKNFDLPRFCQRTMSPFNMDMMRKRQRGFIPLLSALLNFYYNNRENTGSLVELGIGGAGPHTLYRRFLKEDISVLGVDFIHENMEEDLEKYMYEKHMKNYHHAQQFQEEFPNVKFLWGCDSYDPETATKLFEANDSRKIGILIDDSDTNNGSLNGLNHYKEILDAEGIIISEGPFGNGESVYTGQLSNKEKLDRRINLASETNQMVIFNTAGFMVTYPDHDNEVFPVPYIGVYMSADMWKICRNDSGFELNFKNYIVAGEEYMYEIA
jgi:hypothetical protein